MGGLTPPGAGSGTTQHPVPLLVGWAQHTFIHPGAWNRCSSTFGLTLWIVLPTPSAQPTQISASLSLKDPEAAPSSERSAPKTSIKRVPWFLSSPSPLSPFASLQDMLSECSGPAGSSPYPAPTRCPSSSPLLPAAERELWHHWLHHVEKAPSRDLRPRRPRSVEKVSGRDRRSKRGSRHPRRNAPENMDQERFHEWSGVRALYGRFVSRGRI